MNVRHLVQVFSYLRARLGDESGQAMVEYSSITYMILIGGIVATAGVNFPGTNQPFIIAFMSGMTTYLNSLYFWIDMPMP